MNVLLTWPRLLSFSLFRYHALHAWMLQIRSTMRHHRARWTVRHRVMDRLCMPFTAVVTRQSALRHAVRLRHGIRTSHVDLNSTSILDDGHENDVGLVTKLLEELFKFLDGRFVRRSFLWRTRVAWVWDFRTHGMRARVRWLGVWSCGENGVAGGSCCSGGGRNTEVR